MAITAAQVKELRARTGAGILESKKALEATNGDINKAITYLQEQGAIKAAKKAGRIAAEGQVYVTYKGNRAAMIELNCETDFVAMNDQFSALTKEIANKVIECGQIPIEKVGDCKLGDKTVSQSIENLISVIKENISLRRIQVVNKTDDEIFGSYVHSNKKIASIVKLTGNNAEVAKNIAMHVAAMNPEFLDESQVSKEKIAELKNIIAGEMKDLKKPDNIKEKIIAGKLKSRLSEFTLVEQQFVMDKIKVGKYASNNNSKVLEFVRFEVGEGIQKREDNFVEEVRKQQR